jgi:vacuolar protein sorting-associated protein 13A/C
MSCHISSNPCNRISIYAGNVVLKNLRLKPGALEELDLPITVQGGLLGSLTLKVPWNALGRAPVEVSIDSLYLLAVPRVTVDGDDAESSDTNGEEDPLSAAALETAFQRAKLQRVARQEARWLDELQSLEKQRSAPSSKEAKGADGGGGGAGFLRGLIDTIIGNLQLSITNVHVRYEDALTHPGHPFACGFLLEQISASTVDEVGRPTFVTTSALDLLRKALNLRSVAVYFDCNEPGWEPGRSWRELPPEEWATWFHPRVATKPRDTRVRHDDGRSKSTIDSKDGRSEGGSTTLALQQRQYVLQPIDGRATYVRRGRNVQREEDEPASDFDVKVDSIAVSLSREQYQSYSLLLAQLSVYSARRPHQEYRPRVRPTAGKAARAWWQYARLAVKQQSESHRLTWQQVLRFLDLRREYVPLYLQHLKRTSSSQSEPQQQQQEQDAEKPLQLPKGTTAVPEELAAMDAVLPENTILMFRRLAYAEFQRERRREARAARAASKSAAQSGGGGWLGWLMGSGGAAPAPAPAPAPSELQPASEETLGEQRAELSAEEYNKLMDWVSQQDEGLKLGMETPYTLLTRIRLAVGSAAAVLSDGDGDGTLLRGSLLGISVETDMYPKTRRLQVGVTAMEVEGPDGIFVQTGASAPDALGSAEFDRSSKFTTQKDICTSIILL